MSSDIGRREEILVAENQRLRERVAEQNAQLSEYRRRLAGYANQFRGVIVASEVEEETVRWHGPLCGVCLHPRHVHPEEYALAGFQPFQCVFCPCDDTHTFQASSEE